MNRYSWCCVFAVAVLVLFACSKKVDRPAEAPSTSISAKSTEKAPPDPDRFLRFALETEPEYLDPGLLSEANGGLVATNLFERLLIIDPHSGELVPGAAETWEVSDDLLIYTFHLRKNAKWSDGLPVTAHDFVYAWERVLNPKNAAKYAFAMHYLKNGQDYNTGAITDAAQLGFTATDDYTLTLTLEEPTPFILDLLSKFVYAPVPRQAIEAHGDKWTHAANIVTNGPFHLKEWVPYKNVTIIKSDTHWNAANMKIGGVHFYPIEERETAYKMYEAGQLDIAWNVPEVRIPQLMGRKDFVMHPFLAADFFRVNVSKAPFDNKLVRQALALAIDRETLCNKYLRKMKVSTGVLVPMGVGGYTSPPGQVFDPQKAKRLLTEAGFANPKDLGVVSLHYNTDETLKLVAQVVQQMWQKYLGIEVELFNEEYKSHLKTMKALNYDVTRSRWIGDYVDPNTYLELFVSDSTINRTGWKNTTYDALIAAAAAELDQDKRFTHLQQAEAILLEEAPVIPLYVHTKAYLIREDVRGYSPQISDQHEFRFVRFE